MLKTGNLLSIPELWRLLRANRLLKELFPMSGKTSLKVKILLVKTIARKEQTSGAAILQGLEFMEQLNLLLLKYLMNLKKKN